MDLERGTGSRADQVVRASFTAMPIHRKSYSACHITKTTAICAAGFTCSAGIAANKLLAKVASAMNKPNQQTVVPPRCFWDCWHPFAFGTLTNYTDCQTIYILRFKVFLSASILRASVQFLSYKRNIIYDYRAVDNMMRDLPLKKLRNFGGKLGEELKEMGCTTAGQVAALPHRMLTQRFGEERASIIARAVRGYSDDPVQVVRNPCKPLPVFNMSLYQHGHTTALITDSV